MTEQQTSLISVQLRCCFRGERLQQEHTCARVSSFVFLLSTHIISLTVSKCMKHLLGHRRSRVVFINALLSPAP